MNASKLQAIAGSVKRPYDDVLELWTERAAIREYEGGAKRRDAEEAAYYDVASMLAPRASDSPERTRSAR